MKASSGIDLMVSLDRDAAVGLRAQLEHQLRESVRSGTLRHDAPLPSTRALARELGVARGVVMEAYAQLTAEGYLVSRQGGSTRVAARAAARPSTAGELEPSAPRFDFRPGAPDVSLFPRTAWAAALRQGLREAPDARLGYSDPRGTPELRGALGTYLGRVRGVAADPAAVMVTSGLTQGLALTCRALAALARHLPALRARGAAAGLHLLLDLPHDADELALVRAARSRGVGLDGLAPHSARPARPGVILGYGRIAEPAIERGVRELADAIGA